MFEWIKKKFFHPYDRRPMIKRLLGYCDCPNHKRHYFVYPSIIHMNTAYVEAQKNYICCCEDFYETEIAPGLAELWSDYYSSRL